jgi:hypothetical protein
VVGIPAPQRALSSTHRSTWQGLERLKRILCSRSLGDATREHVAVLLRALWAGATEQPPATPELAGGLRVEPMQDAAAVALLEAGVVQCAVMVLGAHVADAALVLMSSHASPPLVAEAAPSDDAPDSPSAAVQVRLRVAASSWVTLRARWVALRARWVTLRARWVTLSPNMVRLEAG